jgi:hypothetical protein
MRKSQLELSRRGKVKEDVRQVLPSERLLGLDQAGKVLLLLTSTESLLVLLELLVESLPLLVLLGKDVDAGDGVTVRSIFGSNGLDDGDADEERDEDTKVPPL